MRADGVWDRPRLDRTEVAEEIVASALGGDESEPALVPPPRGSDLASGAAAATATVGRPPAVVH